MKTWMTPVMQELNVSMTENGVLPAVYESDLAGRLEINGVIYLVVSGFLWESGMDMNGCTSLEKPYYYNEDGSIVYYEG